MAFRTIFKGEAGLFALRALIAERIAHRTPPGRRRYGFPIILPSVNSPSSRSIFITPAFGMVNEVLNL
jgi:hypothetical protein